MPRPQNHIVKLSEEQREELRLMVTKGEEKARVIRRAHTLLLSEQGKTDEDIARILHITVQTVYQTRRKFAQRGIEETLFDKPRPGAKKKLDSKKEAHVIALTCSTPPAGRERWTIRLLTEKVIQAGIIEEISRETVRKTLKKTTSSRGRRRVGVFPK